MSDIITISREYGSGGREIGERLSKLLGVPLYDKTIIRKMCSEYGFSEEYATKNEEIPPNTRIAPPFSLTPAPEYLESPSEKIYLASEKVIKELAEKEPCIIIGRCADYVLRDSDICRIFIHADLDNRVERKLKQSYEKGAKDITEFQMRKHVKKVDKLRKKYSSFYTQVKWGDIQNYDICINTSNGDLKLAADILANYSKQYKLK